MTGPAIGKAIRNGAPLLPQGRRLFHDLLKYFRLNLNPGPADAQSSLNRFRRRGIPERIRRAIPVP